MAAFRVLFDVPSYKRQLECGPPQKKTRWIIHPAQFWRGNPTTHTKIVADRATIVRFWFQKDVRIRETIFVKMTCESLNSEKNWPNRSQSLNTCFENDANRSALFRFRVWIENRNCEAILVKMVCELLKSVKNKGIKMFFVHSFRCTAWRHKISAVSLFFDRF